MLKEIKELKRGIEQLKDSDLYASLLYYRLYKQHINLRNILISERRTFTNYCGSIDVKNQSRMGSVVKIRKVFILCRGMIINQPSTEHTPRRNN